MGDRRSYESASVNLRGSHALVAIYRENKIVNMILWDVSEVYNPFFSYLQFKLIILDGPNHYQGGGAVRCHGDNNGRAVNPHRQLDAEKTQKRSETA